MRLTRLSLTDFRGYPEAELHPDPGLTIVAGPNGAGKTNLLEAVHVAITGRSHRAAADHELVRHGQPFARVRLDLAGRDGDAPAIAPAAIELVIPGETAPAEIRKRLTVNGVPRRASSVSETARSVLFRPEEMLLLIGAPAERRRFLDGILAQRDRRVARDLVELVRVLAQRNALLRAIRREEATDDGLAFWDEQLAQVGARVMAARLRLVRELGERIPGLHDAVAPPDEGNASVELTYLDTLKDAWPDRPAGADDPEALVLAFRRRIADSRQKEMWNGVSLIGPQRDDLRVALGGRDVATHASRGQQRTIIVALKLAECDLLGAEDAPAPIVLLDDVFSELDRDRAERTLDLLLDRGQVMVTTADLGLLPTGRRQRVPVWQVGAGELHRSPRVA
ncbi:MAG TPA: DNA replication/repair protein RecF [Candidatus Limnocylindria bacterium]|nr:DNA replication/repair protein RecF [Candidatus Limnocylindria bacterium]